MMLGEFKITFRWPTIIIVLGSLHNSCSGTLLFQDPRTSHECMQFFHTPSSAYPMVLTREDMFMGRQIPKVLQGLGCNIARLPDRHNVTHPLGSWPPVDATDEIWWGEVPKAGSSAIKVRTGVWATRKGKIIAAAKTGRGHSSSIPASSFCMRPIRRNASAFAFVRNPLERLVSAYGTIIARKKKHAARMQANNWSRWIFLSEPGRFKMFADLMVTRGPEQMHLDGCGSCPHAYSQMHVLNQWHGIYSYIGHTETFEQDWTELVSRLGSHAPHFLKDSPEGYRNNANEGSSAAWNIRSESRALRRLLAYYAQDYACLGYERPVF